MTPKTHSVHAGREVTVDIEDYTSARRLHEYTHGARWWCARRWLTVDTEDYTSACPFGPRFLLFTVLCPNRLQSRHGAFMGILES